MKILIRCIMALAIMFAITATAQAETDPFTGLTQNDGEDVLKVLDTMGLEVIPRSELEEVRGEVTPPAWLIKAVGKALGNKVAAKLDSLLRAVDAPTYAQYKEKFGTKTAAVLQIVPWYLKPAIAE